MTAQTVLLILVSVILSSASQFILKIGMTSERVQAALAGRDALEIALVIGTSPLVIGGLFCFGLSAVVWLFVLSRVPLSSAYPFVALGIVATVLIGWLVIGEQASPLKLGGVSLIVAGLVLVGLGS